ncbi:MAG TPA: hypothetical protein VHA14_03565 [Bryobacteraceae bacterium]|nr:hypothetical protein [Bryobacteraceae bacterium]
MCLNSITLPGQVPAPPSSGAGLAGFAEQLQLAALTPPDAPDSLSNPGATNSLPLNTVPSVHPDDAGNAGPAAPAQPGPLTIVASIPPAAPIALHSTAQWNTRGVLFSSMVSDGAPQASGEVKVAPEAPVAPLDAAPAEAAPAVNVRVANAPAANVPAASVPVANVPVNKDVKAQQNVASAPAEKAPVETEAAQTIAAPALAPAPQVRPERKDKAHSDKNESTRADAADDQPQQTPAAAQQPQAPAAAPAITAAALPIHMVLPISTPRFSHPLTPLGNRIPVATSTAVQTPARTETPAAADPFHSDSDPKAAALPAETTAPLIATADQLAFAAKVQLAKPQAITQRVSSTPLRNITEPTAAPKAAEPVHSEARSQQHDSHAESDSQQPSMKAAEAAVKTAVRPMQAVSNFHAATAVTEERVAPSKTAATAERPASAAAASDDITPTRPEMPAAPMKDISVRIQSEQGENVDVRIVRRAGDLQIAVKAADGDTTQGLRHGLSELSDRLNATGYHAETWHPAQAAATDTPADSGNSQHSQQQQSQGDSQSNSGWSQQQGGQRDDNQSNRPRWIEELETNISSPAETGQFHGLIR